MSTFDSMGTGNPTSFATDRTAGSTHGTTDNALGRTAQGLSEAREQNDAREPTNSTIRSILMAAAGLSIAGSLVLHFSGRKPEALFVGQWPATLLIVALWYQEVKDARQVSPQR